VHSFISVAFLQAERNCTEKFHFTAARRHRSADPLIDQPTANKCGQPENILWPVLPPTRKQLAARRSLFSVELNIGGVFGFGFIVTTPLSVIYFTPVLCR
jgi:hypothetical protein